MFSFFLQCAICVRARTSHERGQVATIEETAYRRTTQGRCPLILSASDGRLYRQASSIPRILRALLCPARSGRSGAPACARQAVPCEWSTTCSCPCPAAPVGVGHDHSAGLLSSRFQGSSNCSVRINEFSTCSLTRGPEGHPPPGGFTGPNSSRLPRSVPRRSCRSLRSRGCTRASALRSGGRCEPTFRPGG